MDIAPKLKDMTEALQALPLLFDAISVIPGGALIPILVCIYFLASLVNKGFFSQMLNILEHKERKRLEQINQYLSSDCAADPESCKGIRR